MNFKSNTLNTLEHHIRSRGFRDIDYANLNIQSIFTLRYLFDVPNDIVNLQKDIEDLSDFPQRLNASYRDEWIRFIKKSIAQTKSKDMNKADLAFPSSDDNAVFSRMLEHVSLADKILNSSSVAVLKSERLRKIEKLIE